VKDLRGGLKSPMCLKTKGICSVTVGLLSELVMTRSLNREKKTPDLDYIDLETIDCPSVDHCRLLNIEVNIHTLCVTVVVYFTYVLEITAF
jgi:hypothetical protein